MAKFNTHVAVHKDPAETVWFAPGDEVPDWAFELVGDHVYGGDHQADGDADDVRLTDPHYEDDDPETEFRTTTDLPPANDAGETEADEDLASDYSELTKDELKDLCEERGLAVSGNKAELVARLEEDDAAEEDEEE